MANIDFITFLTRHSSAYAAFLRKTGEALKSNKHNILWKCVLSNKAKKIPENYENINKVNFAVKNSSLRHGLTINSTLPKVSSDYVIISDVDVAMTYKNWDDEIVKILDGDYSCFGSENIVREREHLHFPNVPFFCFKKDIMKEIQLDFTPRMKNGDLERLIIKTKEEAEFYEKKIGEIVIFNSGSRLYKLFKESGLKGKSLSPVLIGSNDIQLEFMSKKEKGDILKDNEISTRGLSEFHYNGNVFLTHVGRSHKRNFKIGYIKNWVERIQKYVKKKYNIVLRNEPYGYKT